MKTLFSVLLDFVPYIVAFFIKPAPVGLVLAVVITGLNIYKQSKTQRLKIVTVVNGIYFIVALLTISVQPNSSILSYGQLTIYLVLTISTVLSLLIGDPFTMQYAKESTPEAVWKHPIFMLINRLLTGIWAILFVLSTFFSSIMLFGFIGDIAGTIWTNCWNVIGMIAMIILPDKLQIYYLNKMEPKLPKELAWSLEFTQERPSSSNVYDAIIIGSGIGGLACAIELASKGAKVLVLEQHSALGGVCTTYGRKGGFKFDAGVESISGLGERGSIRHFLKRHEVEGKIKWLQNTYEFRTPTEKTVIPKDFGLWQQELIRQFPEEESGIRSLFREIKTVYDEKNAVFDSDCAGPNIPKTAKEKIQFAKQNPHYIKWAHTTWKEFLDAFIQNKMLRKQMSMLTGYVGDKKENTSTDIMISLMGYFVDGGFRPEGGSGQFAKVLVDKLKEYGGEILAITPVKSIHVENQHVTSVSTKKGTFFAPVVISNACPKMTYEKLIGLSHLSEPYQQKVKALEPSMSLFVWTAAIRKPFGNHHLIHYQLPKRLELSRFGIVISHAGIHSASALDSKLAPVGSATVTINLETKPLASALAALTEAEYLDFKAEIDKICRQILADIDSEAVEWIEFSEVATPKTFAHYIRTYEGSIYNIKRENMNDFPQIKSPIRGLYLTGAGTAFGPGIEAVVISGCAVADEIHFPIRTDKCQVECGEARV